MQLWGGPHYVVESQGFLWDIDTLAWVRASGSAGPSADVTVTNFPATQAVSGPLTDTQLRATPVPTSAVGNTSSAGNITANGQSVVITVPSGAGGVGIQITGTWTGQIDFQATIDGSIWVSVPTSNGVNSINATAGNGVFVLAGAGYGFIRAISTSWSSGTAVITMNASVGSGPALLSSPLPQGTNVIGHVIVDTAPTTPVTGTFFQSTQPVSIASMPSTPVTGTFFQSTQPVSGTLADGGSGKTLKTSVVSLSATGTVVAAVGGKRIKAYALKIVAGAAVSVNWRDGGSTALEGAQALAINGGYVENVDPPNFILATTAGNSLDLVITGIGTVAGRVSYWDDDAA